MKVLHKYFNTWKQLEQRNKDGRTGMLYFLSTPEKDFKRFYIKSFGSHKKEELPGVAIYHYEKTYVSIYKNSALTDIEINNLKEDKNIILFDERNNPKVTLNKYSRTMLYTPGQLHIFILDTHFKDLNLLVIDVLIDLGIDAKRISYEKGKTYVCLDGKRICSQIKFKGIYLAFYVLFFTFHLDNELFQRYLPTSEYNYSFGVACSSGTKTGITDEYPEITEEKFIELFLSKLVMFLNGSG